MGVREVTVCVLEVKNMFWEQIMELKCRNPMLVLLDPVHAKAT